MLRCHIRWQKGEIRFGAPRPRNRAPVSCSRASCFEYGSSKQVPKPSPEKQGLFLLHLFTPSSPIVTFVVLFHSMTWFLQKRTRHNGILYSQLICFLCIISKNTWEFLKLNLYAFVRVHSPLATVTSHLPASHTGLEGFLETPTLLFSACVADKFWGVC